MTAYEAIVVGTDGSESSLAAVASAGRLSAACGARLVICCAYAPMRKREVSRAREVLGEEAYQVVGSAPARDTLQTARDRAAAAGARGIVLDAVRGEPVETLVDAARRYGADLLVVGNRGLRSLAGRLLGSVPADVSRRSRVDVLIVHTT
ncbi:universal stress protein [Streptomyces boncukensis]|uniref:Universal stress protein n=1 Tax=Streptomyces boncukensis TaxID=2711219 RepID=A0A6G4X6R5_9ACTN|nr:universal stress protein [Streptomyces boncukensis]NGO72550.1 universal stress protein [Streptomyces boncukensis]